MLALSGVLHCISFSCSFKHLCVQLLYHLLLFYFFFQIFILIVSLCLTFFMCLQKLSSFPNYRLRQTKHKGRGLLKLFFMNSVKWIVMSTCHNIGGWHLMTKVVSQVLSTGLLSIIPRFICCGSGGMTYSLRHARQVLYL